MDFRNDFSLVKLMFICEFTLEMIAEFKLLLALTKGQVGATHWEHFAFLPHHDSSSWTHLENLGLHCSDWKPLIHFNPFILLTRKLKSRH